MLFRGTNPKCSVISIQFLGRNSGLSVLSGVMGSSYHVLSRRRSRNRRASHYLQDDQRDRQTRPATFSVLYISIFLLLTVYSRTDILSSQHRRHNQTETHNVSHFWHSMMIMKLAALLTCHLKFRHHPLTFLMLCYSLVQLHIRRLSAGDP